MKKEPLVFLITLVVLAGLWFLSSSSSPSSGGGRGRPVRGQDAQPPLEARRTPGRFLALTDVTWASDASNIFETPTETRDLPPLDIAPPPVPRLPYPGPSLPMSLNAKARTGLRRVIVPVAQPSTGDGSNGGGGGATAQDSSSGAGAGTATQPTAGAGPLIPIGKELSAVDRIKLSMEAELKAAEAAAAAKQSEEDRRKGLDKLVYTNQSVEYGELAPGEKNESRYKIKADLDHLRTDPSLTEPERNDRLKKFTLRWRLDKRGKLGKATLLAGEAVQQVIFADTVENRYRQKELTADKKDVAVQTELIREVFQARQFKLAAEHLQAMRKAGLTSVESLTMLADALHEVFDYNQEVEVLKQGVKDFPESVALLGRFGRLQALLGLNEAARMTFAAVLAKNPTDSLANMGMGEILLRTGGDAQKAIAHFREALNLAGSDAVKVDSIRLLTAEAYLSLGDFKNARDTVDLVLQRSNVTAPERQRQFERAFTLAAVAALGQSQLAEARTRAEEGAKRYPLSGQLSLLLGIVMMQQGELQPARAKLAVAVELDPLLTGHAEVALAALEEAAARDNEAVATAEAGALTANPAAPELRLPFGRALLHVGDLARAREQLLAALDAEPKSPDTLAALGDVAYAENNLPDAIRFYDRAAALESTYPQLLPRRIIAQVRRRKLAEAEELVKSVTTDPTDPFLRAAIAYFQYSKGNQAEALQHLAKLGEANAGKLSDYAADVHRAVLGHQNKTMWTDGFSRLGSVGLGRDWKREVGNGVNVSITGQSLTFDGAQRGTSDAPTMIWQERAGDKVWGFSVDLDLPPQPGVYAGVGLMVMNQTAKPGSWPGMPQRQGGLAPYTGLQVALSPENKLVYRVLVKGAMNEWQPVPVTTYAGGPVTLELRLADPREGVIEVLVNRESVLKQTMADLKRFRRTVELQLFCQGQLERKVHFTADNVVIVTLKESK